MEDWIKDIGKMIRENTLEGKICLYDMLLWISVVWIQLVNNAHAHITLTLLIYYSTILFFYFRYIWSNGLSYTGGYKQGRKNGKGEYEWEDGSREIAYYVDDYNKEGAAKYYDKNGNEEDRFYKNGELVEK